MVTVSTIVAYQHSHHLFSKSLLLLVEVPLPSTIDLSSFWSQFPFHFPMRLHRLQFSGTSVALVKRELSFDSKFSKTFGLKPIYTYVIKDLNILQGKRGKHPLLAILPSTVAQVILDFTCRPYFHCSPRGHVSIDVSIKQCQG